MSVTKQQRERDARTSFDRKQWHRKGGLSVEQIAAMLHISKQRVSFVESKALRKLRVALSADPDIQQLVGVSRHERSAGAA